LCRLESCATGGGGREREEKGLSLSTSEKRAFSLQREKKRATTECRHMLTALGGAGMCP